MRLKKIVFLLPLLLVGLSPAAVARTPKPVTSAFFVTQAGGFISNYPDPAVSYTLTLRVLDTLPRPAYLQVEYENPGDPDKPDLQYLEVQAGQQTVDLKSRFFSGARNRKSYRVVVEVFSDKAMKSKLGEHVQKIEFVEMHL
jgi:hypothetical protein